LPVFLRSTARTPYGTFGGAFRRVGPEHLAALAIRESIKRAGMGPEDIEALILGQALRYGQGTDPGRQAALAAELPCPSWAVDQGSLSGVRALISGIHAIESGAHRSVVAAATCSASTVPYLLPAGRWGHRLGQSTALDPLLLDTLEGGGPWQLAMEKGLEDLGRGAGDLTAWIAGSRAKALAPALGSFPVTWKERKGTLTLTSDESPAQTPHPPVPGWPLPPLADGAASLVLSAERSSIRIAGFRETRAVRPTEAIITAVRDLLGASGLRAEALDRMEVDESLLLSPLGLLEAIEGLDPRCMNPHGGAFASGQAHGVEGLRLLVSLCHGLAQDGGRFGLAAMESAEGQAFAILIERTSA